MDANQETRTLALLSMRRRAEDAQHHDDGGLGPGLGVMLIAHGRRHNCVALMTAIK